MTKGIHSQSDTNEVASHELPATPLDPELAAKPRREDQGLDDQPMRLLGM